MTPLLFRMLHILALVTALSLPSRGADELAWPGVEYTTVKAYLFGGDSSHPSILIDGNLTTSVEKVARLSAEQIRRVPSAIEPEPRVRSGAKCYNPHHAIVYFDEFGRVVAHLELCYECDRYECSPPLPTGKILNLGLLTPLLQELGIPLEGSKEFDALIALEKAAHDTTARKARYGYFDETTPESAKVWPWREIETVKVIEFTEGPLVHLGKISKSVVREATLTADQRAEAWKCIARPEWKPMDASLEIMYRERGEMRARRIGTDPVFKWNSTEPNLPRHGLVCFDKKGLPVAWLGISFSDQTYNAHPNEGPKDGISHFWHIKPLQKIFEHAGVFNPTDYQKLVNEEKHRKSN